MKDKFTISAECHSDDFNVQIKFDAVKWFEQALDNSIEALAECDFGGDYAADCVAEYFEDDATKELFDYLRIVNKHEVNCGFECHINSIEAIQWIAQHRPALNVKQIEG